MKIPKRIVKDVFRIVEAERTPIHEAFLSIGIAFRIICTPARFVEKRWGCDVVQEFYDFMELRGLAEQLREGGLDAVELSPIAGREDLWALYATRKGAVDESEKTALLALIEESIKRRGLGRYVVPWSEIE